MRVVVVGAGKLGYSVAQMLAQEQYDVVVVEKDEERCEVVKTSLDVMTILLDGTSPVTMQNPFIKDADVLLAVTDKDEVNMVTCMLAKRNGIKRTVARIRNMEYSPRNHAVDTEKFLHSDMDIDLVINPEEVTAIEINRILQTPAALDIEEFAGGKVRMFEAKLAADSPFVGKPLKQLQDIPRQILVAMVFRNNEMFIPHGNTVLQPNDNVFFVGQQDIIADFAGNFNTLSGKINRVMIIGAGRIGRILAPMMDKEGFEIKVIDKDPVRCREVAEQMENGIALLGDGTDIDLLVQEGVAEADVVVCLTEDDKLNLLLALMAKHLGCKKTIVRLGRNEYAGLMEKVGIDLSLSTRLLAAGEILRFIRRSGVVAVSLLEGAKAEAMEIVLSVKSPVIGVPLAEAGFPHECLICAVVHDGEVSVPCGSTKLYPDDRVVVLMLADAVKKVLPFFEGEKDK